MQTNVIDFTKAKQKHIPDVVHVGDIVEWEDFDGQVYEGRVTYISHKSVDGTSIAGQLSCFPLWEKSDYCVEFKDGLSVIGDVILKKVIRKGDKLKTPFNPYWTPTYAR